MEATAKQEAPEPQHEAELSPVFEERLAAGNACRQEGNAQLRQGELLAARGCYQRAARQLLFDEAQRFELRDDHAAALLAERLPVELNLSRVALELGLAAAASGDVGEKRSRELFERELGVAVAHAVEAVALAPGSAKAHYRHGCALLALGRAEEAAAALGEAAAIVPADPGIARKRGDALALLRLDRAETDKMWRGQIPKQQGGQSAAASAAAAAAADAEEVSWQLCCCQLASCTLPMLLIFVALLYRLDFFGDFGEGMFGAVEAEDPNAYADEL